MKILILGGVAAGTKAAAKIKREIRTADVMILTKGHDISYAGCGLPYYIGGIIREKEDLIVNTPEKFSRLTGADVITGAEATAIDFSVKTVFYEKDGMRKDESYDKLIIATGASPIVPDVPGKALKGVFTLRTPDDAAGIREYAGNAKKAAVIGAGFIGLEAAENLMKLGLSVTVIDMADQIMPKAFDYEMAHIAGKKLKEAGMGILLSARLEAIEGKEKAERVVTDKGIIDADIVILALGVRPNTAFLDGSGLEMEKGAIVVGSDMSTNIPDVYAAGDAALVTSRITGKRMYSAMGSTANMTARILAKCIGGADKEYPGAVGTGIVKLLDSLSAGRTGLTEDEASKAGYSTITAVAVEDDKAHYYEGSSPLIMKLIADRKTHRILGFQAIGAEAVDKMTDIAVLAVSKGMRPEEFDSMDFAYAPPFSTAISPFAHLCNVLENKILGELETITPLEYLKGKAAGYRIIDALPSKTIPGAEWIDITTVNGPVEGFGKDEKLLLVCARGKRGYFLQNRLKAYGYTATRVLEGGITVNDIIS